MTVPRVLRSVLLFLLCAGVAAVPVVGQLATVDAPAAQVELVGPSTVTPGETVTVRVDVTADRPIYAAQFALTFDGTALTPGSVAQGDFLSRNAESILISDEISDGDVDYGETRVGTDAGVDGTGTLATVSFTVAGDAASGNVSLELRNVKLATPDAEPVETSTSNLTVTVREDGGDSGSASGGGGGAQPGGEPQGEVEITNSSLLDDATTTEGTVVTRVDLVNFDPTSGSLVLTLTANGSAVAQRGVSVAASSERTVYLRHQFDQPGTYTIGVNGAEVGTVTVTAAVTAEETPTATPGLTPTATQTSTSGPTETDAPPGTTASPETEVGSKTTTTGDGAGFGVLTTVTVLCLLILVGKRD